MAYQLLEIVDGDLRVCYEYGNHEELHMKTPAWITIYKGDSYVSLSLTNFHAVVEQDWESLLEHGLRVCTNIDDGRLLVEVNGPNLLPGELLLRNGEAVWKTQPQQPTQSERHQLLLTLAEHALLTAMECVLHCFDHVVSLGGIGAPDGSIQRKHTLTAKQLFWFSGDLHTCKFTAGGELTVEPCRTVAAICNCVRLPRKEEEKVWADKARLRLTHIDAATLLAFNREQVFGSDVPLEGLQFHLSDERGVGIWPSRSHFPYDDACALVPFTPSEWRWLCACIGFYQAAIYYLKERGERSAERPRPAALSTPTTPAT